MLYIVVWKDHSKRYTVRFKTFRLRADAVQWAHDSEHQCDVIVIKSDLTPELVDVEEVP